MGGEHTVKRLTLYSLHRISSGTEKWLGRVSYAWTPRVTEAYTFAVMLLNTLLKACFYIGLDFYILQILVYVDARVHLNAPAGLYVTT